MDSSIFCIDIHNIINSIITCYVCVQLIKFIYNNNHNFISSFQLIVVVT